MKSSELLTRSFHTINSVEVEICQDHLSKFFIRHQIYWAIAYENRHVEPVHNCVIDTLKLTVNSHLPSRKWIGHDFQFENLSYEDSLVSHTVRIPILMFEDFIRFQADNYSGEPPDNECTRLGNWLNHNSLFELLEPITTKSI